MEEGAVRRSFFRLSGVEPFFLVRESNRLYPGYFISVNTREAISQKRGFFTRILYGANAQAQALMAFLGTAAGGVLVGAASYLDASNREKFKAAAHRVDTIQSNVNKKYDQCQRQPGVDPAKLKELADRKEDFDRSCDAESNRLASSCEKAAISRNITSEDPFKAVERIQAKSDAFSSKTTGAIKGGIDAQAASKPLSKEEIREEIEKTVSDSFKKAGIPVPPKASPSSPKAAPKGKGPGDDEGPFGGVGPFGGSGPSLPGGGSGPEHPPIPPLPSIQLSWWELFF